MASNTGTVIIQGLPNREIRQKVEIFLSNHVKNLTRDKIADLLEKTPLVINNNISEKKGYTIVKHLKALGASAEFVKNPDQEQKITSHGSEDRVRLPKLVPAAENDTPNVSKLPSINYKVAPGKSRLKVAHKLIEANKELWLILSMVGITALINYAVASQYLLLSLYTLPTILSAYFFGRRHAVLTAIASILLVVLVAYLNPLLFTGKMAVDQNMGPWYHIFSWACILVIIAYTMGSLYKKNRDKMVELRQTYRGLLIILRHFISNDEYTENHCYRVSVYAAKIAAYLGLSEENIEDIRSAALLHDLGKLEVSRRILYKAARLTHQERREIERHVNGEIFEPIQGPLDRIIPLILGHHDRFDGSGYTPVSGSEIPMGARILAVADVYDAMTSDRPYRKAMSPFEVKDIIVKGSNKEFDPDVVRAFVTAFDRQDLEMPSVII